MEPLHSLLVVWLWPRHSGSEVGERHVLGWVACNRVRVRIRVRIRVRVRVRVGVRVRVRVREVWG